ncbi:MAG: DMT family transporter [Candidatus Burarchaeum sp.]|nr:DMT family transporter [Candidatus Burarchaeum sp.]MDO8340319.1 DMT family transporter [Candidatus Burarchaeum sp.]
MKVDGRIIALGSLFLWSLSPPLSKLGLAQMGYLEFSLLTALAAAALAVPFFIHEKGWTKIAKHWKQLALLALFTYFLFSIFYFLGMSSITGAQGSALLGTEILFSLLLGVMMKKERGGVDEIFFTLLLVLGVAIAVTNGTFDLGAAGIGALLVLFSMFLLQLGYYLAPDAIHECGFATLVLPGVLAQALATLALFPLVGASLALPSDQSAYYIVAVYGLLPILFSYAFYYEAIRRIGVYKTTAIVVPAPAVALFLSALLLGEQITAYNLLGVALIVLSVWKITEVRGKTISH